MKMTIADFKQNFQYLQVDQRLSPDDRKSAIGFALARGIAYALDVPRSPVTNARMFYIEQLQTTVQQFLSEVVEFYAFSLPSVERLTEQLWSMRYKLVHCPDFATDKSLVALCSAFDKETEILTPRVRELFPQREIAYTAAQVTRVLKGV